MVSVRLPKSFATLIAFFQNLWKLAIAKSGMSDNDGFKGPLDAPPQEHIHKQHV